MTNQQHPITPPPELVAQWKRTAPNWYWDNEIEHYHYITLCAAQWGADQELEACIEWFDSQSLVYHRDLEEELRAARRPKPLSLKKQAYAALDTYIYGNPDPGDKQSTYNTIRRALESIND